MFVLKKKRSSLKLTITLSLAALILVTTLVVVGVTYRYLDQQRITDARLRAEIIAYSVQYMAEVAGDSPELNRTVQALGTEKDVSVINVILPESDRIIATNRFDWRDRAISAIELSDFHRELLRQYSTAQKTDFYGIQDDGVTFTYASTFLKASVRDTEALEKAIVIVDLDTTSALIKEERKINNLVSILLMAAMIITALIYLLLAHYVFRPLTSIVTTIHRRSEGDSILLAEVLRPDELGMLAATFNELVEVEEHNKRALLERERQLQLIFDTASVRIWYKDDKNTILKLNKGAAESMGMSVDELEGRNMKDLFPQIAEHTLRDDLEVIQSGQPKLNIVDKMTSAEGKVRWVKTDKIPYTSTDHSATGVLIVAQDITDLKEAEDALRRYNAELERSNRELDEFAYSASHDLKSPLRGIDQLATWIAEDIAEGQYSDIDEHASLLCGRVRRMERLLSDLLAYSRVGRREERLSHVNCRALIQDLFDLCAPPESFQLVMRGDLPIFNTYSAPFEQVLGNLLNNAIKHHDRLDGIISVSCKNSDLEGFYEFAVRDDGPGIDQKHHQLIFQMFKSLKSRDDVEGSGMGLSLVKKIINNYGGEIRLVSSPGQGATFYFTWPKDSATAPPSKLRR